jgi:probable phosphoglycerate mutase
MKAMEARGLDLLPPNGESPRQVRQRLLDWLRSLPLNGVIKAGAVTHKGVIRALLTEATGWDMQSSCPVKIDWACALRFTLEVQGADTQGKLHLSDYNIPLTRTAG